MQTKGRSGTVGIKLRRRVIPAALKKTLVHDAALHSNGEWLCRWRLAYV